MMVVDLLHEFELGVWKALLTHLIRILHVVSERPGTLTDILNSRYVQRKHRKLYSHCPDSVRFLRLVGLQSGVSITTSQK
jgi:hypothetical protein